MSDTKLTGFARLDPDRRREMSRKGGASVPAHKRAFSRDPASAVEAGRKGGSRPKPKGPRS